MKHRNSFTDFPAFLQGGPDIHLYSLIRMSEGFSVMDVVKCKEKGVAMELIIPKKLKENDVVATVSLSWGGAGDEDILWRYHQGVRRLEEEFALRVRPMPNSLMGTEYLYKHPEKRAEDLMQAFLDPEIKAIICNIGGEESIRLLPYLDLSVIRNNPKIVMGYSDSTIVHLCCLAAGIRSYYGPLILVEFAENVEIDPYTVRWMRKTLFDIEPMGLIETPVHWTSEHLPWEEKNRETRRKMEPNTAYQLLQGTGAVQGHLLGGCMEVLEMAKGTEIFPKDWAGSILFFETSEERPEPSCVKSWLRNYAALGILQGAAGLLFAKPYGEEHQEDYHLAILQVLAECGREDMPVLTNLCYGHTEPMCILPYGALAKIDCEKKTLKILEPGVTDS